jgi:3-phenylpropionate/trans-cinnamate dioxygenase ferredoxin subunit
MAGIRAIAIFNVEGRFYALRDACPHQGAALSSGTVVSEIVATQPGAYRFDPNHKCVKCPWHGWEYDLETGRSYYDPRGDRVRSYDVAVEAGAPAGECITPASGTSGAVGRVPGPFTAEAVYVTTEADDVVLYV